MRILVTGGGGFLGAAIVRRLLDKGYEVRSFSRGSYRPLDEWGVTQYQGDISDLRSLEMAVRGCRAVMHVAARVGYSGDYSVFHEVNVRGTENVIRACRKHAVPHLIYTSTPSVVYQGGSEGKDESLPYPDTFDAWYPQTKALAEKIVLQANGPSLRTCALRPHIIWGPGDPHFLPRIFELRRKGRLRVIGDGNYLVDTIYVGNAARAHVQALELMRRHPETVAGKAYFLSQDEPIPIRTFLDRLLACGGLPPVNKTLSPAAGRMIGWAMENFYRLFKIKGEPPLTTFMAKQLSSPHWFDISAAKRDLGYEPRISLDEGMARLKAWVEADRLNGPGRTT